MPDNTPVMIELSTVQRIANATRKVEKRGVDITRQQLGRRTSTTVDSDYTSSFAVTNTSDEYAQSIKVVLGYDIDNSICGHATINDTVFEVSSEEIEITETCYLYLNCEYDSGSTGTPTFEISTSYPAYEADIFKKAIAHIIVTDNVITSINLLNYGDIIGTTFGEC